MQIILPTWLGSYFGADFSFEELEYRTVTTFKEPVRRLELSLYETKWFDYVRLHPLQATYYFYECYRRIHLTFSKRCFGEARYGTKCTDFLESREHSAFWNLRVVADSIGVAYPWLITKAFETRLESGAFKNRLPRPCHLVTPDEVPLYKELWNQEHDGTVLAMSSDPFFSVRRWVGDASQRRHEDYLVQQVKRKAMKRYALSTLIYEKQVLRLERALVEFPREIEEAQLSAENFRHSSN